MGWRDTRRNKRVCNRLRKRHGFYARWGHAELSIDAVKVDLDIFVRDHALGVIRYLKKRIWVSGMMLMQHKPRQLADVIAGEARRSLALENSERETSLSRGGSGVP